MHGQPRTLLAILTSLSLMLLGFGQGVTAADEDMSADHPVVGVWAVEDGGFAAFHEGGTFTGIEPSGNVAVGVWEPAGDRTADLTFQGQLFDEGGTLTGHALARASVDVSDHGSSAAITATVEVPGPEDGTTGQLGPIVFDATRITVEPMGEPVGPFPPVEAEAASGEAAPTADQETAMMTGQQADLLENPTGAELLTTENTSLVRSSDGMTITLRMPTPEPGTYPYPEGVPEGRQAAPEVFTGWAAVFNHPEHCITNPEPPRCGAMDITNEEAGFGIHNFGAHVSSIAQRDGELLLDEGTGGMVVISGTIEVGEPPYLDFPVPPGGMNVALENPAGAEVHAPIAPHGQVDPSTLPDELFRPLGSPDCGCWWVAIFLPSDA